MKSPIRYPPSSQSTTMTYDDDIAKNTLAGMDDALSFETPEGRVVWASKSATWEPTRHTNGEGRRWGVHASWPCRQEARVTWLLSPTGVMATACLQGNQCKRGKPQRWRRVTANKTPVRDRLGRMG